MWEKYRNYMETIDKKGFKKSTARLLFNFDQIAEKYAKEDHSDDVEIEFGPSGVKVYAPTGTKDSQISSRLDHMKRVGEQFGNAPISAPEIDEEASGKGKKICKLLNEVFEKNYEEKGDKWALALAGPSTPDRVPRKKTIKETTNRTVEYHYIGDPHMPHPYGPPPPLVQGEGGAGYRYFHPHEPYLYPPPYGPFGGYGGPMRGRTASDSAYNRLPAPEYNNRRLEYENRLPIEYNEDRMNREQKAAEWLQTQHFGELPSSQESLAVQFDNSDYPRNCVPHPDSEDDRSHCGELVSREQLEDPFLDDDRSHEGELVPRHIVKEPNSHSDFEDDRSHAGEFVPKHIVEEDSFEDESEAGEFVPKNFVEAPPPPSDDDASYAGELIPRLIVGAPTSPCSSDGSGTVVGEMVLRQFVEGTLPSSLGSEKKRDTRSKELPKQVDVQALEVGEDQPSNYSIGTESNVVRAGEERVTTESDVRTACVPDASNGVVVPNHQSRIALPLPDSSASGTQSQTSKRKRMSTACTPYQNKRTKLGRASLPAQVPPVSATGEVATTEKTTNRKEERGSSSTLEKYFPVEYIQLSGGTPGSKATPPPQDCDSPTVTLVSDGTFGNETLTPRPHVCDQDALENATKVSGQRSVRNPNKGNSTDAQLTELTKTPLPSTAPLGTSANTSLSGSADCQPSERKRRRSLRLSAKREPEEDKMLAATASPSASAPISGKTSATPVSMEPSAVMSDVKAGIRSQTVVIRRTPRIAVKVKAATPLTIPGTAKRLTVVESESRKIHVGKVEEASTEEKRNQEEVGVDLDGRELLLVEQSGHGPTLTTISDLKDTAEVRAPVTDVQKTPLGRRRSTTRRSLKGVKEEGNCTKVESPLSCGKSDAVPGSVQTKGSRRRSMTVATTASAPTNELTQTPVSSSQSVASNQCSVARVGSLARSVENSLVKDDASKSTPIRSCMICASTSDARYKICETPGTTACKSCYTRCRRLTVLKKGKIVLRCIGDTSCTIVTKNRTKCPFCFLRKAFAFCPDWTISASGEVERVKTKEGVMSAKVVKEESRSAAKVLAPKKTPDGTPATGRAAAQRDATRASPSPAISSNQSAFLTPSTSPKRIDGREERVEEWASDAVRRIETQDLDPVRDSEKLENKVRQQMSFVKNQAKMRAQGYDV